jgi:hypothetical protein
VLVRSAVGCIDRAVEDVGAQRKLCGSKELRVCHATDGEYPLARGLGAQVQAIELERAREPGFLLAASTSASLGT